jgi:hypothetical protein
VLKKQAVQIVKRVVRNVAPGAGARMQTWLIRRNHQAQLSATNAAVNRLQRRFDEQYTTEADELHRVANESSLVVFGSAPYSEVSALIDALSNERVVLGELVIVDTTAELMPGAAITSALARWRFQLPLTRLNIVKYTEQDVSFSAVMGLGFRASQSVHVWFGGRDLLPLPGAFEYLLKTYIAERSHAIVVAWTTFGDGSVLAPEIPEEMLSDAARTRLLQADSFTVPYGTSPLRVKQLVDLPVVTGCSSFARGIFGGPRAMFQSAADSRIFDPLFHTEAAVGDASIRLHGQGAKIVATTASLALCTRSNVVDGDEPWQGIHDWRWMIDKRASNSTNKSDRIEMVCPFHRGDVVLAMQLAAHFRKAGQPIRLHVAAGLEAWARNIDPLVDIESIAVPVASAQETYPQLLAAYKYVSQRADASPRLARCHPARSLSDNGGNLFSYMYEQVKLPPGLLVENMKPQPDDEDREVAREIMERHGDNALFVHPFGGWDLKSVPTHILVEMAHRVRAAGFKFIQIGGASDARAENCDGAILENFLPSRWRAILELGHALIGVDSWTAHFASILDVPQVTLYGSTHPTHVRTKPYFAQQKNQALALGPTVNCSPCNSLTCVAFPGRKECTGFSLGREFDQFLESLKSRTKS